MKNSLKNLLLLVIVLILSYFTAPYFGTIYNNLFPFELNSGWVGSSSSLQFIRGISLSLIFFITIFSYIFALKSWRSVLWLLSPLLLWEAVVDFEHIYIPIILTLIGLSIAWIIRKIFKRYSNPPMIIK